MTIEELEKILKLATENALDGTLMDETRLTIAHLALTMLGAEFLRIEEANPGTVDTERLLMVRQLVLLIEPGCSAETLMANMEGLAEIMRAD